jgi:hypothetical protein
MGGTALDGHYITYARNIAENPNIWFIFNDLRVT